MKVLNLPESDKQNACEREREKKKNEARIPQFKK
jgi:hypothetical protein